MLISESAYQFYAELMSLGLMSEVVDVANYNFAISSSIFETRDFSFLKSG